MGNPYILDTETASLQGGVCELAYLEIDYDLNIISEFCSHVNPERPIEPGAQAVHGITDEMVKDAPTLADIAKHFGGPIEMIAHNCLSEDTEFLSQSGWKRLADYVEGDSVCQYDTETAKLTFCAPSAYVSNHYEGQLLYFDSKYHKGAYTPDHRVYLAPSSGGPLTVVSAAEAAMSPINQRDLPCSGFYEGPGLGLSEVEIRLLEAVRADGSFGGANAKKQNVVRFNLKKSRKVERLRRLLNLCGQAYSEVTSRVGVTCFSLSKSELRDKLHQILGREKQYGDWVLQLSVSEKRWILDEAQYWDGSRQESGSTCISSASAAEIGWFQVLAATAGFRASGKFGKPNSRGYGKGRDFTISTGRATEAKTCRLLPSTKCLPTARGYSGKVYCFTVPTSAFLVRRNGTVWVTGNCSFDVRMIKPHITAKTQLCTLKLARALIKGTTNFKLETLQAELKLPAQKSHSALGDVHTVRDLLLHMREHCGMNLAQYMQAARVPSVVHLMPFGKHMGKPLTALPASYRDWLLQQELEPNLKLSLERLKGL